MSKVVEYVESLLMDGASPRMAVMAAVSKFKLGALATQQLWTHYGVDNPQ